MNKNPMPGYDTRNIKLPTQGDHITPKLHAGGSLDTDAGMRTDHNKRSSEQTRNKTESHKKNHEPVSLHRVGGSVCESQRLAPSIDLQLHLRNEIRKESVSVQESTKNRSKNASTAKFT